MECNKDEAVRARELAEKKMSIKDFSGARKMVMKAQKLDPNIENVTHMLAVCDVHCSAAFKVHGSDPDWYSVLQIGQTADEASIKKQFRKFALLLHPDKNKFPGAEAAFKLIGEAHTLLCDPARRYNFDWKRNLVRPGQQKQQKQPQPQPIRNNYPNKQAGSFSTPAGTGANNDQLKQQQTQPQQTQPVFANGHNTFLTACPFCSTKSLAYRDRINRAIRCQTCMKPFIAFESVNQGIPSVANKSSSKRKEDNQKSTADNIQGNQPPVKKGRASVVGGAPKPKTKEDVNIHGEAGAEAKGLRAEPGLKNRKRGRKDDSISSNMEENGDHNNGRFTRSTSMKKRDVSCKENASGEKGRKDDSVSSNMEENGDHISGRFTRSTSMKKRDASFKENASGEKDVASRSRRKTTTINEPVGKVEKNDRKVPLEESTPNVKGENCRKNDDKHEGPGPVAVEVPDPDFYDFDGDRSEKCFAVDQVWSIYDDLDGMPRFYALIKKVHTPFKVDIRWLDVVARDPDETAWRKSGLPVACGKFKYEKTETIDDLCIFSHRIVLDKGVRGFMIYPRKGETWALHKNWNMKWSSDPDNHRQHEYELVVVLSDYTQESGILVTHLVKLKGFVCLFMPTKNNVMASFQIPSNEILRFSHRVPSIRTNGKEREDVPEGYFELDPASMPSNLLEVPDSIDVKADDKINGSLNVLEEKPRMAKKTKTLKSTLSGSSPGRTRSSSRMSNGSCKSTAEENVEKSVPETFRASDNLTACVLPKSEFYAFEADKTQDKFQAGQVWALYCVLDGLPKYYAVIKKVESTPEFKVSIQWLEACTPRKGVLQGNDNEIPTCCGVFSGGEKTEFAGTATFSHLSKVAETSRRYKIYPRKGEVWAIYKNFSLKWSSSDLQTCQYDIGEVTEVEGEVAKGDGEIKVLILEKVSDYQTVFKGRRVSGRESTVQIQCRELLRFSHQIPAIQLTDERQGTLRGCWALDPKAMPVYFFNSE